MGGFINCMKREFSLENGKIIDDDDAEEEEEEENGKYLNIKSIETRSKSQANFRVMENNSNILHYNENFLDLNGDIQRKKSNTVFMQFKLQKNI